MDNITKNLMKEFARNFEISDLDDTKIFEHFINYLVAFEAIGKENIDFEDFITPNKSQGIDGGFIVVNGAIIDDSELIIDYIEKNKYLNTTFHFIQTKTSDKFDLGEISKFIGAVTLFFTDDIWAEKNFFNLF